MRRIGGEGLGEPTEVTELRWLTDKPKLDCNEEEEASEEEDGGRVWRLRSIISGKLDSCMKRSKRGERGEN